MSESTENIKIPVAKFVQTLTSSSVPPQKAMAVTGRIYKDYNTPALLTQLTDAKLKVLGIEDKDTRKGVLSALRKAGYAPTRKAINNPDADSNGAGPSTSAVENVPTPSPRKKRKRDEDLNELLPSAPRDDAVAYGSLEFNEDLDEEVLMRKFTVVNRAPLMTAWATVVAERQGFQREEALSIASVYTEMNAISKGVSLGIYKPDIQKGVEASKGSGQPYVDLMGRRVPLYQTQSGAWRALASGTPAAPSAAFSYISRSLRQTAPFIVGALRLLADTYTPAELNTLGFSLYADFRPDVDGWGKRGEVRCERILEMRKKNSSVGVGGGKGDVKDAVKVDSAEGGPQPVAAEGEPEPEAKKVRGLTLEEYEAALDDDPALDLDAIP